MMEARDRWQEQIAALRRTQILDAATKVFAERGFHRTTIRDVAKAAGVADGTIYNYFENKTALLLGILDRLNETERRDEDLARAADMDLREFSRQYVRQRLAIFTEDNAQAFQVVLSEALVDRELRELIMGKIVEPTFALAEAHFKRLAEMGKFPPQEIALRLRLIASTFLGALILRILGDPQLQTNWDAIPDLLTAMIYDGLLPEDGVEDERHDTR
jgi:TetR/AcrR family fatty acid metabolism transcriptional regulator